MEWVLVILLIRSGEDSTLLRFPMPDKTTCNEIRQGVKFAPGGTVNTTWNWSSTAAVWCAPKSEPIIDRMGLPPVEPVATP